MLIASAPTFIGGQPRCFGHGLESDPDNLGVALRVPSPRSVPAIIFPRPTNRANLIKRSVTNLGCSTPLLTALIPSAILLP